MLSSEARFPLRIDWERVMSLPEWQRGGSLAAWEAPRVAFPLRSEWEALHPADAEPFPEPLRRSDASGGVPETPKPVVELQRDAQGAGWATQVTYALGYLPHATHGRPGEAPKASWALRMQRGSERAVAVRFDATWLSLWRWSAENFFERFETVGAFIDSVVGELMDEPKRSDWDKMLVKYPLKPTRAQWAVMRGLA